MKELTKKIIQECSISKTLREKAWIEQDFSKSMQLREKQQEHWNKFNFMKELDKALQKEGK